MSAPPNTEAAPKTYNPGYVHVLGSIAVPMKSLVCMGVREIDGGNVI